MSTKLPLLNSLRANSGFIAIVLALAFALPAYAGRDTIKPTAPKNFRVTAVTPFSVSLAWSPSSDNSGKFSYRLWSSAGLNGGGIERYLTKTTTSYNWTLLIHQATTYTFRLWAVDEAGNKSTEVIVTVTTPPDTIAPSTAPVITVEHVNDTYVKMRWTAAQDDGPYLYYDVFINGGFYTSTGTERNITIEQLTPETTYTFVVRARDDANNLSPASNPVTVTTAALGSVDTTPPTRPENFTFVDQGGGEVWLFWTQSTDDFDDQSEIRYDIYVQGMFSHSVVGTDFAIAFTDSSWLTVIDLVAVDTSGNQSGPATVDVFPEP